MLGPGVDVPVAMESAEVCGGAGIAPVRTVGKGRDRGKNQPAMPPPARRSTRSEPVTDSSVKAPEASARR